MDNSLSGKAFSELNDCIINLLNSFSALSSLSSLDIRYPDIESMLRKALMGLMENMDMQRSSVFLLEGEDLVNCVGLDWDDILRFDSGGDPRKPTQSLRASIGEGIMGLSVQKKTLQHCRDCSSDPRYMIFPGHQNGSLISVPIFQLGGDVVGVLNVSHKQPHFFSEWHERFLLVYCNCLGQLIVNHRLVTHMDREIEKRTSQLILALEETRAVEKGLRESENRMNLVLEGSNDGFWDWSLIDREIQISRRYAEILGYTQEEVQQVFSNGKGLIHPDDVSTVAEELASHLAGTIFQYAVEYRMLTRSGEWKWILDRGKVVEWDESGRPLRMTGTTTDVTDRRRTEEEKRHLENQLNHSQKMEAVGQLAGGVAHEFNNIMTAIIGYGHLIMMKTVEDNQLRHYVSQILTSAERASGLTKSLLTFSRKQITNPFPVNVNEIVEKIGKLLSRIIREDIEFRTELCRERVIIMADDGQIEQVVTNLVTNARDAMPNGGVLTIRTEITELDDDFVQPFGYGTAGDYVRISVIDTGTGMDEKTREKIFEPFFTTKEPGKGTGLGLAIAYGIIKLHKGLVEVSSRPGEGTEFTMCFPLVREEGNVQGGRSHPVLKTGSETILIAEDDDDVRKLDRELLEECGYTILEASNGKEALEIFTELNDKIDLVIFDVIMPKMNGREVYEEILKIRPDLKALFTSGYTSDILDGSGCVDKKFDFVAKPLPPDEFLEKVRELLDRE